MEKDDKINEPKGADEMILTPPRPIDQIDINSMANKEVQRLVDVVSNPPEPNKLLIDLFSKYVIKAKENDRDT